MRPPSFFTKFSTICFTLFHAESKDGVTHVFISRTKQCGRPLGFIRRVGILLTFQTNAHVLGVGDTMLAGNIFVGTNALEVTAIDLYARLVGIHLHEDAGLW